MTPAISMFYGLVVYMYFMDTDRHQSPHVHVKYQEQEAVLAIPDGTLLDGNIPSKKLKLVQAWILIHEDDLMADWSLASKGEAPFKIDPLR